jgi:hypothetical protein
LRCSFTSKFKAIDITNNTVLEGIKAHLWSRNGLVILKFANKEDESGEGNKIDGKNNSENEDK